MGCHPKQPLYLFEKDAWQKHYIGKATKIDYPNVDVPSFADVCESMAPPTVRNPDLAAKWELTLEEALHTALKNSQVIRTLSGVGYSPGGVSGVPSALLQSAGNNRTVYDPALMESDPRYGQEAALAAFDAQLKAGIGGSKTYYPHLQQVPYKNDGMDLSVGISKYAATGTYFYLNHANRYSYPGSFDSDSWTNQFVGGFSHPLLQGGGIEFNRIAGPSSSPGNYGGVAIARINTDMSLNDFEMATRTLVADVERAYWNLHYAYRRLDSVRSGRDAAHETWRQTQTHHDVGSSKGALYQLAQAEENYFQFQQQTELAQNNLFKAEAALRYIIGVATADGRLILPIDEPITAPIGLDWRNVVCEALFRSPELRKQKWSVKQRELEVIASKNFLLPQLNLDGQYQFDGTGNRMIGARDSAYGTMEGSGWSLGLNLTTPLGMRRELAGVRNAQLNLAKARAILREQEFELTHQLGDSFREIDSAYRQMQITMASLRAAKREVEAVWSAFEADRTTLDQVLQARRRESEAETGYHSSVVDYNLAIMTLHYRKGSLLEYNNVCLTEGEWPGKAYFDAKRRARERAAGHYFNYGATLPGVVSRGAFRQYQNNYDSTSYDLLPNEDNYFAPPPSGSDETFRVIETDPTVVIPTPVLPKSGETTPVSFSTLEVASPESTLTPSRNMRYVR
ncbi:MAG: TolC family protein [Planctomycetaceae bacterium]|nr:TolC family protein [Planctomycetaceae bacterium]